jgi:hypothetical protein
MSDFVFKPAVRESVGLLIGLIGPSGSGKTFSAMRIAAGIVGPGKPFAVIDTENRRALHYASQFQFDHCELSPPFSSLKFAGAIEAADKAGYKAIVVDSCSHEWASEGGVLDFQEAELTRMAGDDYKKREACKMAAWIKPKGNHKQMVQRLLRSKAHLLLCFRAEEKTKIEKGPDGKMHIIPMGFQPVCSKELPYELTVSFLLSSEKPGIGQPIKLQEQHKAIFPSGKLLDESSGKSAAEWAKGGVSPKPPVSAPVEKPQEDESDPLPVGTELRTKVDGLIADAGIDAKEFKAWLAACKKVGVKFGHPSLSTMKVKDAEAMVAKWDATVKAFNLYVDKKNAA